MGARDIGEHEGGVAGQGFGEDGEQGGECIVGADSDARDGAIDKHKDRSDVIDAVFDMTSNTPLVELVLLYTPGVGQAGCVKETNLGTGLRISAYSRYSRAPGPTTVPFLLVNSYRWVELVCLCGPPCPLVWLRISTS